MEEAQAINPYLLRGFTMEWMNQLRSTDITSIRLQAGRVHLVAVKAWFSGNALSWAVSLTVDLSCGEEALHHAFAFPDSATNGRSVLIGWAPFAQ
jgi:putative transposase